jgi:aspartyl-tRNA(Asn)/glutamyl-tRNA(Gln) amidotransferase subunit B
MNSFRFVKEALEFESKRQRALLAAGRKIYRGTSGWNPAQHQAVPMRGKEEAHDYRYFPDPDLVPVRVTDEWIAELRKNLPELPAARLNRFLAEYGLPEYDAEVLTSNKTLADYFEATVKSCPHPKPVSNWIMVELLGELYMHGPSMDHWLVTPEALGKLLTLKEQGGISGKMAKMVFKDMVASGRDPEAIIKEKGLAQISDTGALEALAREIISANPKEAADYRAGKSKILGFFVGQLMRRTQGQANPQLANEIFQKMLR